MSDHTQLQWRRAELALKLAEDCCEQGVDFSERSTPVEQGLSEVVPWNLANKLIVRISTTFK
jgi:hypothetical protein